MKTSRSVIQATSNIQEDRTWPELKYETWKDTLQTLQRWIQIVGKIRLSKSPWVNHAWHATLYVTETGLTTSIIHDQATSFAIDFDFSSHFLRVSRSDGRSMTLPLRAQPVASFYDQCLGTLADLDITAHIHDKPNELLDATPFSTDKTHRTYDPEYAKRFWQILLQSDRVMKQFRSRFVGKVSPVHFFWGSFDLAVTRFSGRLAPEHPGGVPHLPDLVAREAYSHEVSSCGFWPGNEIFPEAAFYSYAYPKPNGFEAARMPKGAYFHDGLKEFLLPYDVVRKTSSPDQLLLDFFQSSYEAAADLGQWDRGVLEPGPYLKRLQERMPLL